MECQGKAIQFLLSRKKELDNILKTLDDIKSPDPKLIDMEKLEIEKLTAPLDTVFEEGVKPLLDRLLAKEQRERIISGCKYSRDNEGGDEMNR